MSDLLIYYVGFSLVNLIGFYQFTLSGLPFSYTFYLCALRTSAHTTQFGVQNYKKKSEYANKNTKFARIGCFFM